MKPFLRCCSLAQILWAALLAGCGSGNQAACQEQVRAYTQQINPITTEWGAAVQRANAAPPADLSPAIASMQEIRRRTDSITVPECANNAHGLLTRSMDMQLQGFRDTLDNKPTTTVKQEFSDAAQAFANFEAEIRRLAGAP
jgi:hypothetical protein